MGRNRSSNPPAGPHPKGTLIAIGGHEDKTHDRVILHRVAGLVRDGRLVIATLASSIASELWDEYRGIFHELGVRDIVHLNLEHRVDDDDEQEMQLVKGARAVFFTGGDQLKITSKLGGSRLCQELHSIYARGGLIAGTSAGASVLDVATLFTG